MRISDEELKDKLYEVLDEVTTTGRAVEIERRGRILRIEPVEKADKLKNLTPHPDFLKCDPEDIIHMDWSGDWRP